VKEPKIIQVNIVVHDMDRALEQYTKVLGKDEFYYLDTEPTLGILLEIGNNGNVGPPGRRYPA
jgi:catechol 2,3-dioxygenase-like lactoylglutathione lyase family enzyme